MNRKQMLWLGVMTALIGAIGVYSSEKSNIGNVPQKKVNEMSFDPAAFWKVAVFRAYSRGRNDDFNDYTFQFNLNGSISVFHENVREYGNWTGGRSVLQMEFESNPLNGLNNNWTINDHSAKSISLEGADPSGTGSEILVLKRVDDSKQN